MSKIGGLVNQNFKGANSNVWLTLGSVDAEAIDSQTQKFIGVINKLAADVVAFCSQAVKAMN